MPLLGQSLAAASRACSKQRADRSKRLGAAVSAARAPSPAALCQGLSADAARSMLLDWQLGSPLGWLSSVAGLAPRVVQLLLLQLPWQLLLLSAFDVALALSDESAGGRSLDGQLLPVSREQYLELQSGGTIVVNGLLLRLKSAAASSSSGSLSAAAAAQSAAVAEDYHWFYRLLDSSKITFLFISTVLIVHGSFRSLKVEQENQEQKDRAGSDVQQGGAAAVATDSSTIGTYQAIFLPLGASLSLLVVFFYFESLQLVFALCTAVLAAASLTFLVMPLCKYLLASCVRTQKLSLGCCGRYTAVEIVSFAFSVAVVTVWVMTGHWILMDALGMSLCVAFIALVRLPSLKVSTLLLCGLVLYDVFWVFFSSHIFSTNVMVRVATQQAENPMSMLAKKLQLGGSFIRDAPKLSLPGKLVFPSIHGTGGFSMLGLGDIVMPGLLLCFVLRYDLYKRKTAFTLAEVGVPLPATYTQRLTYFHCSLVGYILGLLTATVSSEVFRAAQPALLYLVPFTLLPLVVMAYLKGDLLKMWTEPFATTIAQSKYLNV